MRVTPPKKAPPAAGHQSSQTLFLLHALFFRQALGKAQHHACQVGTPLPDRRNALLLLVLLPQPLGGVRVRKSYTYAAISRFSLLPQVSNTVQHDPLRRRS